MTLKGWDGYGNFSFLIPSDTIYQGSQAGDIPISSVLRCLMITLTKLQLFDWLIHEVMRCECHLQYATGSLMLFVGC